MANGYRNALVQQIKDAGQELINRAESMVHPENDLITSKKVIHYDFISGISVGCKYHQNWTETYRSGEAIL